jgi:hypothetical protein
MNKNGIYFWLQSSKIDLKQVATQLPQIGTGKTEPIIVIFDVYQKFKLDCGFPKRCGEMTTEEFRINRQMSVWKNFVILHQKLVPLRKLMMLMEI